MTMVKKSEFWNKAKPNMGWDVDVTYQLIVRPTNFSWGWNWVLYYSNSPFSSMFSRDLRINHHWQLLCHTQRIDFDYHFYTSNFDVQFFDDKLRQSILGSANHLEYETSIKILSYHLFVNLKELNVQLLKKCGGIGLSRKMR